MRQRIPVPNNASVEIGPYASKQDALRELHRYISKVWHLSDDDAVKATIAVAKVILTRKTRSQPFHFRGSHLEVERPMRAWAIQMEEQKLKAKSSRLNRLLSEVRITQVPKDHPLPPVTPRKGGTAVAALEIRGKVRSLAANASGPAIQTLLEVLPTRASRDSLGAWGTVGGHDAQAAWARGYAASPGRDGPEAVIAARARLDEIRAALLLARAELAGAVCSWAELSGSYVEPAQALGRSQQAVRAMARPRSLRAEAP